MVRALDSQSKGCEFDSRPGDQHINYRGSHITLSRRCRVLELVDPMHVKDPMITLRKSSSVSGGCHSKIQNHYLSSTVIISLAFSGLN